MNTEAEIMKLSPERRKLLELLMKQSEGIPRRAPDALTPISSSQQRFWILDQLKPNSNVFNTSAAMRLQGQLKLDALQQALTEIVRRHESLRATFKLADGQPAQVFEEPWTIKLPRTSLHDFKEKEREGAAHRFVQQEASRSFDLAQGPLFRVRLFALAKTDHVLLFTFHHIVADGWSMGLLVRELATLYEAFVNGKPSPLPETKIQFGDFAIWEREYLNDELVARQLAYWKTKLAGKLPQLTLPADRERTAQITDNGATYRFRLPTSPRDLSLKENVSLYTLLLAAYAALFYRYTGAADVVIGSPTANRPHPDTEDLVGCFINTLLMRIDLSGNPTFRELLARVRETTLDAFANQDVPFNRVVDQLEHRQAGESPYRVWFVLQNAPLEDLKLTNLTLTDFHPERSTTPNDLTLSITEVGDELACTLDYRTDLFDADTVIEFSSRFTKFLDEVSSAPETRLLDIPIDEDDALAPPASVQELEDAFAL
ncbi:MAG TPA: condensation domain-containing protein [Pyrinomonadaceae bacterium]|nr:condensation domain-containing protein [Pyrinomonadaceae bacterium]